MGARHGKLEDSLEESTKKLSTSKANTERCFEGLKYPHQLRTVDYETLMERVQVFDLIFIRHQIMHADDPLVPLIQRQPLFGCVTHVGVCINHTVFPDWRLNVNEWYVLEYVPYAGDAVPDIYGQTMAGVQIRKFQDLLRCNENTRTLKSAILPDSLMQISSSAASTTSEGNMTIVHAPLRSTKKSADMYDETSTLSSIIVRNATGFTPFLTRKDEIDAFQKSGCHCCISCKRSSTAEDIADLEAKRPFAGNYHRLKAKSSTAFVISLLEQLHILPIEPSTTGKGVLYPIDLLSKVHPQIPVLVNSYRTCRVIMNTHGAETDSIVTNTGDNDVLLKQYGSMEITHIE